MSLPPIEAVHSEGGTPSGEPTVGASKIHGRSPVRIAMDRLKRDKVAVISTAFVVFFVIVGVFAPLLTRLFGVELRATNASNLLDGFGYPNVGPPYFGFTLAHPLGVAPQTGYDLLAEWFYGARTSLEVASLSALISTVLGVVIGLVAGFSRGWLDRVVTFVVDVFLSLPFLLMAFVVSAILVSRFQSDPDALGFWKFWTLILILGGFTWMGLTRLIRGEVLSLREREYVQAARVVGVPTRTILFKELLPNLLAPIVVSISLGLPAFVSAEAGFAYLGIGLTDRPSWGQTIALAVPFFDSYAIYMWAPLLGVLALVISLNLLGDAIRDAFDPKTRR